MKIVLRNTNKSLNFKQNVKDTTSWGLQASVFAALFLAQFHYGGEFSHSLHLAVSKYKETEMIL